MRVHMADILVRQLKEQLKNHHTDLQIGTYLLAIDTYHGYDEYKRS